MIDLRQSVIEIPDCVKPDHTKDMPAMAPQTKVITKDRWAERLWPFMTWTIGLFNLCMAVHFGVEVWYENSYHYIKHITTAVTMCATYIALVWAHNNVLRKDHGLE